MLNRVEIDSTISKEENIASILNIAQSICNKVLSSKDSSLTNYVYDYSKPARELGLEEELIAQLIEDYIYQIFKSYKSFSTILDNITKADSAHLVEHLIELKNLAHKNLGVARNLRIEDAQILLSELMSSHTDYDNLVDCADALMACAFKLNPAYAYDVLKLRQIKNHL